MNKIQIPVKFEQKELDKLSNSDINNLFLASDSVNALNRYLVTKNLTKEEIISILKVTINCNDNGKIEGEGSKIDEVL